MVDPVPSTPAQELAEAKRQLALRQDALAHLGHDLRTPLNSIIGFSELMMTGIGGPLNPKHVEFVQAVHRNGHLMLALINDLLDWSTIDAGRVTARISEVALDRYVADVHACTEPVINAAGVAMTWPDSKDFIGITFPMDNRRMVQVALNLLDNGRKFTPRGGRMSFAMAVSNDGLLLTFEDEGPGIPQDEVEHVFQPYATRSVPASQPTPDRIAQASGSGLGLSIVAGIVRLHAGRIQVDRGMLGGARIRVHIPRS